MTDTARKLFEQCDMPDFAPLLISRAQLYKEIDSEKAIQDLQAALKAAPDSWRAWHHLIGYYNQLKMFDRSLDIAQKAMSVFPNDNYIRLDYIQALVNNKMWKKALDLLEMTSILPFEGAREVHELFVECQVLLALEEMRKNEYGLALKYLQGSKRYPEQLGTGRPFDPDFRMQDYLMSLCFDKKGEDKKAEELRKEIYAYTLRHLTRQTKNSYFGALILEHFGEHDKAKELFKLERPSRDILNGIKAVTDNQPDKMS